MFCATIAGRDHNLLFYTEYENILPPAIIGSVATIRKDVSYSDLDSFVEGYYNNRGELMHAVKNMSISHLEDAIALGIVKLHPDYVVIRSVGYSQGDCVRVLVNTKAIKELNRLLPDNPDYN